eukprot:scaffold1.g5241.t1
MVPAAQAHRTAAASMSAPAAPQPYKPDSDVLLASSFGTSEHNARWAAALRGHGLTVRIFPDDCGPGADLSRVEMAACFDPPEGLLARCPNLRLIHSMGAGVSPGMLTDAQCPMHLPLLRVVDPLHAERMAMFVLGNIASFQRRFDAYLDAQRARRWDKSVEDFTSRDNSSVRVGIMGAGPMGAATARLLIAVGYPVSLWTRGPRQLPGTAACFHGPQQLRAFAEQADVIVCLVPITDETRGILNSQLFSWLPRGALVINVSRGAHLLEEDLLAALDSGHLGGAVLDVFQEEPLPPSSPLWAHPKVRVFPHVAATTPERNAVALMVRNRERLLRGQPLPPECIIDRKRGY